jgi:hypothetical protein
MIADVAEAKPSGKFPKEDGTCATPSGGGITSDPPSGKVAVTNIYFDPDAQEYVFEHA